MPVLSICMVSLNCKSVIKDCLDSLIACEPNLSYEVIVVDNASTDGTVDYLATYHPDVVVHRNSSNVGFTRATNQAIRAGTGRHILWLNTDTILKPGSLSRLCEFLDTKPEAGIVGPKVLNPDGTFQPQCKRGMPTPLASLGYMLKLDRLFPGNREMQQYLLTYLPDNEVNQVVAVSGCCLLAKREVWEQIGPLDETIFAFGEDIDWCVRAKKSGWEVWYYPDSEIVHLKGKGGVHSKPYHKAFGMHQGMWIFYRRHLSSNYSIFTSALVLAGVSASFLASGLAITLRRTLALASSRA